MSHPDRKMLRWFFSKVDSVSNGCWMWGSAVGSTGRPAFQGRSATRPVYEWFVGAIPAGFELDHLCMNPRCVNPAHMEPVTAKENVRRFIRSRGLDRVCKRGHPRIPENRWRNGRTDACKLCIQIGRGMAALVAEVKR